MKTRPAKGRGLFYTRDSEGRSELAPPQYVDWAQGEAKKLGVAFSGTSDSIQAMIRRGVSAEGDLFLDYGISGNLLSRPGFDAFCRRAHSDMDVSHLFVPRRDRIARPDNPLDAMQIEYEHRTDGLTLVLMSGGLLPPIARGQRIQPADLLTCLLDYEASGKFRLDLAEKQIHAKIRLAQFGFSIGGDPPYGFRRWLCSQDGAQKRELKKSEKVRMPGHHVIWLPTAREELGVIHRILNLIETTTATRIVRMLNDEGIPAPHTGRSRKEAGILTEISGLWSQQTIKNIVTHPLMIAVMEYGRRADGDQMRLTPAGPRALESGDYNEMGKLRSVVNPPDRVISTPARSEAITTVERRNRILAILETRGAGQKGKARARRDNPNPLGARIFDLGCGWPMYRCTKRGRWLHVCGLYQNSDAKCCRHNIVTGENATRFVLNSLRQRLLKPTMLTKLKSRLTELAAAERGEDPGRRQLESDKTELMAISRKLKTVGENMALAETPEQRAATASVFDQLKSDEGRLAKRIDEARPLPSLAPEQEVEAALAVFEHLADLAETPATD